MNSIDSIIGERVLVFDGATGTQIQAADLKPEDFQITEDHPDSLVAEVAKKLAGHNFDGCNDLLNITAPDVIKAIHLNYLKAGSDIVTTNTFGATSIVLSEYGLEDLTATICLDGARIAREACDQLTTPEKPRFVAGAIGPGTKLLSLGQTDWQSIHSTYKEGAIALLQGGVDILMLETLQDILMIKAALSGFIEAMKEAGRTVPIFISLTIEQTGTMLVGSEIGAALNMLERFPEVKVIGLNCATGPTEMATHVRFLGQNSTRPVMVQPNAGLPVMEKGHAFYRLTPAELATAHCKFIEEAGAAIVGGCCGTTPKHIKTLSEAVKHLKPNPNCHWMKTRHAFPNLDFRFHGPEQDNALKLVGCSSLFQFQPYQQDNSLLYIGERTNANGSKAPKDMLANENWDGLTELAQEVEAEGSHVVDVCTAYVGRNEVRDMEILLQRLNKSVSIPIMIDSTEWPVIERSLQVTAGKPIINSFNFEDGGDRAHRVLELASRYGAAVVALTIDEKGMAKEASEKVAIADRILRLTREYGLPDHDIFIDALTFTLGSGDEEFRKSAEATIEAIRMIKQAHPSVNTILGVSNVSFGLRPVIRQIINSAMLHYAQEAGLTSAIVHVSKILSESKITPEAWKLASDLIFDRRGKLGSGQVA